MTPPIHQRAQRQLGDIFERIAERITQLHTLSEIRPRTRNEAIRVVGTGDGTGVAVTFGPVVLQLPEKAEASTADLFVVVTGDITMAAAGQGLQMQSFRTKAAYFRRKPTELQHVFAAHYDYDPVSPGHPLFHAQLDTMPDLREHLGRFHIAGEADLPLREDTARILRTVRIPSAQMDFFAVLIQIAADHLLIGKVSTTTSQAFGALLPDTHVPHGIEVSATCTGPVCLRVQHWYPI